MFPKIKDLDNIMYDVKKSDIDNYFISKGFEFKGVVTESNKFDVTKLFGNDSVLVTTKLYTFKKKLDEGQTIIQVVFNQNNIYRIELTTTRPDTYANLKSEVKDIGFMETTKETDYALITSYDKDAKTYGFYQEVHKGQTLYKVQVMDGKQFDKTK